MPFPPFFFLKEMTMQVKEMMTRCVECVAPKATLEEAAQKMKTLDVGPLPICEDDRLVGMLTDRDIVLRCVAEGHDPRTMQVREIMTKGIVYCFEDEDVHLAAQVMTENQIRRLVVLNRDKRLVGIVSLGDLAVDARDEQLAGETLERICEAAPSTGVPVGTR
jgi:CBS domain-containing protein